MSKTDISAGAPSRLFFAAVWLAVVLIGVKAYYLGVPERLPLSNGWDYLRSLAAIWYDDVLFAAVVWVAGRLILALTRRRSWALGTVSVVFVSLSTLFCVYAVANVVMFGVIGGFLTYPLLALVGNVRMLSSSVATQLTPRVLLALSALPVTYLALVELSVRLAPPGHGRWQPRSGIAFASLGVWILLGQYAFSSEWATRQDRRIADNAHWVFLSSWWQAVNNEGTIRMTDRFPPTDLGDFEPIGQRAPSAAKVLRSITAAAAGAAGGRAPRRRPPNVVLVVLESVAARWTSLNGGPYDATPVLKAESAHGLVFDNFYAHIGRSSNSLAAILLSMYPKLDFRDVTEEYPQLGGSSLAAMFRTRGYKTEFITPSDMAWAGWRPFLDARGFDKVLDYHQLACKDLIPSWGVEDCCMVDGMIDFITHNQLRPFFLMGWTTQTHHPYEPTPGVPLLDMQKEPVPDQYELGRYLNVLHETDHHLGRLFDALRHTGLDRDTLVVVVGDHGQAFGYPHNTYIQGRTVYEEDVHVPLLFWFPERYRSMARSNVIGSQIDLAPTIAELTGVPTAPDWQGHSLFEEARPPRAYFYVAEDHFTLGVREGRWKYILDLREGVDELFDLDRDPNEHQDLSASQPGIAARLRQRLAAWTEANRRQYARTSLQ